MQPFLSFLTTAAIAISSLPTMMPVLILIGFFILFLRIPLLTDLLILPYRLGIWIARHLGLYQKKHTWSVVYDSRTKLPLDPAYVTVRNAQGLEVASMITDINGRFSLILPRGIYTLEVQKTNYAFPSYELRNATKDGIYTNLYYGKRIEIVASEQLLTLAIPMDAVGSDWNQEEKRRRNIFSHFGKHAEIEGSEYLFLGIGAILAAAHFLSYRDSFSMQVSYVYFGCIVVRLLLNIVRHTQYPHSIVVDKHTGEAVSFARVSLYSAATKNKLVSKTTSLEGQFTVLVPNGTYYVTIEERDQSGSYSLRYTSAPFHLASGYLGRKFSV